MVDERTLYWGARDSARYRSRDDDPTGGDYVVAETLDSSGNPVSVLLRWDDTAGEWVSGGPVNMDGNDLSNVGTVDAESINTTAQTITQSYTDPTGFTQSRKLVGAKPIPTPTAYFSGPAHNEGGNAFRGATLAPDGRVVFAPFDSSNVGITSQVLEFAVANGGNK